MDAVIKKVPIPLCGVALAIASLGTLLGGRSPWIQVICATLSMLLLALFAAKVLRYPRDIASDMRSVTPAAVSGTLTMACAVLSGYLGSVSPIAQAVLWSAGFTAHWILVGYFTIRFIPKATLEIVTPAWYVIYVGVAAFCLSWPLTDMQWLKWITFLFGLVTGIGLLVIITVRFACRGNLAAPMRPLICIYAAPPSMCLAAYLSTADECALGIGVALWGVGIVCYAVGFVNAVFCLRQPFSPSYAAMTFPFVISASATTKFAAVPAVASAGIGAFLSPIATAQTVIAIAITAFVFVRYLMFLLQSKR